MIAYILVGVGIAVIYYLAAVMLSRARSPVQVNCAALVLICGALLLLIGIIGAAVNGARARDLDGRFASSPLKPWFDALKSQKGLCCSFADGLAIEDVDWDTATVADGGAVPHVVYRVRIDGQWIVVPPEALVTEPNKFGRAVVWPYVDAEGVTRIRCFIPGSGA